MVRSSVAGAVAVAVAALAGCGGSDTPALSGPPATVTPVDPGAEGSAPSIAVVTVGAVEAPRVLTGPGAAAITAAAGVIAARLAAAGRNCPMTVERADPATVSLRWSCLDGTVATGTWSLATGLPDTLEDVLHGDWVPYLSSAARTQLVTGGASPAAAAAATPAAASAFGYWYITATTFDVVFRLRSGPATVAFPLATLVPYATPGGPAAAT